MSRVTVNCTIVDGLTVVVASMSIAVIHHKYSILSRETSSIFINTNNRLFPLIAFVCWSVYAFIVANGGNLNPNTISYLVLLMLYFTAANQHADLWWEFLLFAICFNPFNLTMYLVMISFNRKVAQKITALYEGLQVTFLRHLFKQIAKALRTSLSTLSLVRGAVYSAKVCLEVFSSFALILFRNGFNVCIAL